MAVRQFQLRQPQGPVGRSVDNLVEAIKDNKYKREKDQDAMNIAMISLLSSQMAQLNANIRVKDAWLTDKGLYGELSESSKTGNALDLIEMIQSSEKMDYKDLAIEVQGNLKDLQAGMDERVAIQNEYNQGLDFVEQLEDQYADYFESGDYEDYLLTGEMTPGTFQFESGSELAALLNPAETDIRLQDMQTLVLADDVVDEAAGLKSYNSKYGTNFETSDQLTQEYNDLVILKDTFHKTYASGSDAFRQGVVRNFTDPITAQQMETSFLNNQSAALAAMQQKYDLADQYLTENSNIYGHAVFNKFAFNIDNVAYDIDSIMSLKISDDEEQQELYSKFEQGLRENATAFSQYFQGILMERADQQSGMVTGGIYDTALDLSLIHI